MTGLLFFAGCALLLWVLHRYYPRPSRVHTPRHVAAQPPRCWCADCGTLTLVTVSGTCATCQGTAIVVRGNDAHARHQAIDRAGSREQARAACRAAAGLPARRDGVTESRQIN